MAGVTWGAPAILKSMRADALARAESAAPRQPAGVGLESDRLLLERSLMLERISALQLQCALLERIRALR